MPFQDIGNGSARYNQNKIRMSYIPPAIVNDLVELCWNRNIEVPLRGLTKLAEHYSLGSAKYPDGPSVNGFTYPNWAKGQLFDAMLINSTLRHLYAYMNGEKYDLDFGSHHLIAVAWGVSCLHHQFANYDAYCLFDDRMWTGFSIKYHTTAILTKFNLVQIEENPTTCCEMLTEILADTLILFELDEKSDLTFTMDAARLESIKSKDYGKPITVSGV